MRPQFREEVELIRGAMPAFDADAYLAGRQTPVHFGSAISNFGVEELLGSFVTHAPPPRPRLATTREVAPTEPALAGFVFKIQANMDPGHRDRIAFLRICSGGYRRGMRMHHVRLGKEVRIADALTFMAADRQQADEAWAGDIIGLHNHGTINIGDTFTEGESLMFTGIPNFAPELFRRAVLKDPLRMKALQKGLDQLCEEGATQLFRPLRNNDLILGAVGPAAVRRGRVPARRRVRSDLRLRGGQCRDRALDRGRRRGEARAVPRARPREPRARPCRRARLPRAVAHQPRAHHRALAGPRVPRDPRAPGGRGVRRPWLRGPVVAWALCDWANSAFATTVMAGFFPVFFKQYWSVGTEASVSTFRLGMLSGLGSLVIALAAPLLGAMADRGGARVKLLAFFTLVGAATTAGLYFVGQGEWVAAAVVYSLAGIGFWGGVIFNDALLVDVAEPPQYDLVSAFGYSLGYAGGGSCCCSTWRWPRTRPRSASPTPRRRFASHS